MLWQCSPPNPQSCPSNQSNSVAGLCIYSPRRTEISPRRWVLVELCYHSYQSKWMNWKGDGEGEREQRTQNTGIKIQCNDNKNISGTHDDDGNSVCLNVCGVTRALPLSLYRVLVFAGPIRWVFIYFIELLGDWFSHKIRIISKHFIQAINIKLNSPLFVDIENFENNFTLTEL